MNPIFQRLVRCKFPLTAILVSVFVGACGLFPHLLFSAEEGRAAWFYNSYDEGFYGWAAVHDSIAIRVLAAIVVRALTAVVGGNLAIAMVAADFLLPIACALAAFFAVRSVVKTPLGMVAAGLLLLTAAEVLAFRSTYVPHAGLMTSVESFVQSMDPRPDGIFPHGNQTSVFWIFRTPEPQVSWVVIFVIFGCLLRCLACRNRRALWAFAATCLVGSLGYMLIMLPAFGGICFAAVALALIRHPKSWSIFFVSLLAGVLTFSLALGYAVGSGSNALVFASRTPAILMTGIIGGVASLILFGISFCRRRLTWQMTLAIALCLAPLLMTNQQIVTGRMLYLFNFENFAFAQLLALGVIVAVEGIRSLRPSPGRAPTMAGVVSAAACGAVSVAIGMMLFDSQRRGYDASLPQNLVAEAYVDAIKSASVDRHTPILCEDIFIASTLPIRLGWEPNFVVSREMTFAKTVKRLESAEDIPPERATLLPRLFESLAMLGWDAETLSAAFDTVANPEAVDWRSRFMLGGLLYNHADFWFPLTHGRDLRLDWVSAQKTGVVGAYVEFLERNEWPSAATLMVGRLKPTDIERLRSVRKIQLLNDVKTGPGPGVRALMINPVAGARP